MSHPNAGRILIGVVGRVALILLAGSLAAPAASATTPRWSGQGHYRVLVKVEPVNLAKRQTDEMVAQLAIDFAALLKEHNIHGLADLSTIQVHKYDPQTGQPQSFVPFESSLSPYDRPCRFEDNAVPADFPDRLARASVAPGGRGPAEARRRGGRLFNREMDPSLPGTITWVHTQTGSAPSHYAIYFDVKQTPLDCGPSPAPWIGDADIYRLKDGQPLGGLSHFIACVGDYNGDGLFDLLAGAEKGNLMWYPNRGTPGSPRFVGCRMLADEQGPIDLGWYAAPFFFDWDNDGLSDVLVGTSYNTIVWWKNVGAAQSPQLSYRGPVQTDAGPLAVPEGPVPEDSAGVFRHDYYNQPWVGDWDADGTPDILTGGYVTGQIFFFRGQGRNPDGTPKLHYVGPLQADGQVLDTVWAAAPCAGDFDNDGKMDLISGSWFWSGIHRPQRPGEVEYLMYYRNAGSATQPRLKREPFPRIGQFPPGNIARPSAIDWNRDGLMDLLVSDHGGSVYCFLNKGEPGAPRWKVDSPQITIPWGFVRAGGFTSRAVLTADGVPDLLEGQQFFRLDGSAYSPRIVVRGTATVNGKPIHHPGPGYGDPYFRTCLCDWDGDGRADLLWGTQQGEIYLHRHAGRKDPYAFEQGIRLRLTTGQPLRVGPPIVDSPEKVTDFTVLQGSRIVMEGADFDMDGIADLAVTDTTGQIWIFRNTRRGGTDTLEPGVKIGAVVGARRSADLNALDWNEDGRPDLIIGQPITQPGTVYLNQSAPGRLAFAEPVQPFDLPFMFWGPRLQPLDWNRDGDEDLLVFAEFFAFYVEKSFLTHGYRPAGILNGIERTAGLPTDPPDATPPRN